MTLELLSHLMAWTFPIWLGLFGHVWTQQVNSENTTSKPILLRRCGLSLSKLNPQAACLKWEHEKPWCRANRQMSYLITLQQKFKQQQCKTVQVKWLWGIFNTDDGQIVYLKYGTATPCITGENILILILLVNCLNRNVYFQGQMDILITFKNLMV